MPTLIERHWPKLALLLTLVLFAGLLFAPALAQRFAAPFIVLTLGMGILLLALHHWRAYRVGNLSPLELARNVFVETTSLLLVFVLARLVGGHVAEFVGAGYGPSTGSGAAWLLALLSALLVGVAAGLAVQKTLGRWVRG